MSVLIVDYGMGNLGSIACFFQECGADIKVSDDPRDLMTAEKIVLPGVGSFGAGINNLVSRGFANVLREEVLEKKIPLLGVCLGMHLLADTGSEGGNHKGLGIIPGRVEKLEIKKQDELIPHVGWNEISIKRDNVIFDDIPNNSDFYFVHSFHFVPKKSENILTTTSYCGGFVSSINSGNIFGVQFHPEKSVPWGFKLIKNFLEQ